MLTNNRSIHTKQFANALLVARGILLLLIVSVPEYVTADWRSGSCDQSFRVRSTRRPYYRPRYRRSGSCDQSFRQMYPRRYNYYRDDCSTRRPYDRPCHRTAWDILDEFILATTNSLSRQHNRSRRNVKRQLSPYVVEDFGSSGLEMSIEVPGLNAQDIDLEVIQKYHTNVGYTNIIIVRGNPIIRRNDPVRKSRFLQSVEINDEDIDWEGVRAHLSSGVLIITLPREKHEEKKRPLLSTFNDRLFGNPNNGEKIPIFVSKRGIHYGVDERSGKRPVVEEIYSEQSYDVRNSSNDGKQTQEEDDLFISEEEDIL